MKRYSDCEITEFKIRQAMDEPTAPSTVDVAVRDLEAGNLDTDAVHEVMGRRAGTIGEYVKVKALYDTVVRAMRHSGAA